VRAFTIRSSDIARCPRTSLAVAHYREDGSCLCACLVHAGGLRMLDAPGRCDLYDAVARCEFEIGVWSDEMLVPLREEDS